MDKMRSQGSLDGCGKFIKYSIFVVNFILFIGGLLIVGLGAWLLADRHMGQKSLVTDPIGVAPAVILLTCGGVVAFITFLGCCGAIKEVKCLLGTFFFVILVITILFIVGAVLLYKNKDQAEDVITAELHKSLDKYNSDEETKNDWDNSQKTFHCCGVTSFTDWIPAIQKIPDSCACTESNECVAHLGNLFWENGCYTKFKEEIKKVSTPLFAVGIVLIVILILAMVFSCSLFLML